VGQQERGAIASQGSPVLKVRLFALIATAPLAGAAIAGPSDYVFVPAVNYGEREDFKYGAAGKKNDPAEQAASLGVGYGLKERWFTEFYVKGAREGAHSNFDAIEFENKFQLTETGKYGIDVGFITEFELPHDRSEGSGRRSSARSDSAVARPSSGTRLSCSARRRLRRTGTSGCRPSTSFSDASRDARGPRVGM